MSEPQHPWSAPSSPAGPPNHQDWAQPNQSVGWNAVPDPSAHQAATPEWAYGAPTYVPPVAPAASEHRLATLGVVLAGIALLGVIGLVIAMAYGSGTGSQGPSDQGYGALPMRGVIAPDAQGAVSGTSMVVEIERQVRDGGGDPKNVSCPATTKVAQDVTTVCHGQIDGDDWAFVVLFEDAKANYTLLTF